MDEWPAYKVDAAGGTVVLDGLRGEDGIPWLSPAETGCNGSGGAAGVGVVTADDIAAGVGANSESGVGAVPWEADSGSHRVSDCTDSDVAAFCDEANAAAAAAAAAA